MSKHQTKRPPAKQKGLTWGRLIRRLRKMPDFDANLLRWHLIVVNAHNKYPSSAKRRALIRALIKHPNLTPEDWKTYCDADPIGALQNPALPLYLAENPSFGDGMGFVRCNVLVRVALKMGNLAMVEFFHAAGHGNSDYFNSATCALNGHGCLHPYAVTEINL